MIISFQGDTIAQVLEKIEQFQRNFGVQLSYSNSKDIGQLELPLEEKLEAPRRRGRPKKVVETAPAQTYEPQVTVAETVTTVGELTAEDIQAQTKLTKEDITTLVQNLIGSKGPNKARELLAQFSADRIKLIKEDDYPAFAKACVEATGA